MKNAEHEVARSEWRLDDWTLVMCSCGMSVSGQGHHQIWRIFNLHVEQTQRKPNMIAFLDFTAEEVQREG